MTGDGGEAEPPPHAAPGSQVAPAGPPQYAIGLNPCPWEVIDASRRLARCKAHGVDLPRREFMSEKKRLTVRYDCPVFVGKGKPGANPRGYCVTGGFVSEIFEEDVR